MNKMQEKQLLLVSIQYTLLYYYCLLTFLFKIIITIYLILDPNQNHSSNNYTVINSIIVNVVVIGI